MAVTMAADSSSDTLASGSNDPRLSPDAIGNPSYSAASKISQITDVDPSNKEIIDALKRQVPSNYTDFSIAGIKEQFLEGKLYTVFFNTDSKQLSMARVYKVKNKNEVFVSDEEMLAILGERYHSRTINFLDPDLVAGYIAFLITLCIGYLIIFKGESVKIPDILGNALTIILGYYFGRSSQRAI